MELKPQVMSHSSMIRATESADRRMKEIQALAQEFTEDSRRKERRLEMRCKACFYVSHMSGSAMTTRRCMCCDVPEVYGSMNADVLCAPCAVDGELCKRCGGDIEMRTDRKDWPVSKAAVNEQQSSGKTKR